MAEICKFINDTDEVDLMDGTTFRLVSFESALPTPRSTKRTPVYADGSDLISRQFENVIETITFIALGATQNDALINLRNLTLILEKGVGYYIGTGTTQTYLQVKFENETNIRYGIVKDWRIDKLPHMFDDSPFSVGGSAKRSDGALHRAGSVIYTVTLVVELEMYRGNPPGSFADANILGYGRFNSRYYGSTSGGGSGATLLEEETVFIANKSNVANISHVYHFDASSSTFSSNLANSTPPFDLFPNPMAVGDILYVGCQNVLADAGPFSNIVFDLVNHGTTTLIIFDVFYYITGPVKTSLPLGTSAWDNTFFLSGEEGAGGSCNITWYQPSDQVTTAVNGVTAFWIGIEITEIFGPPSTVPVQQNRSPYTVTWPFIEIADTAITGDEVALARYNLTMMSPILGSDTDEGHLSTVVMGLKSGDQSDISLYWNASDEQNATGITYTTGAVVSTATSQPTGRKYSDTSITSSDGEIGHFTISTSLTSSYVGRYRVFILGQITAITGTVDDIFFYLRVSVPNRSATTFDTVYSYLPTDTLNTTMVIDMGEVSLSLGFKPVLGIANPIVIAMRAVSATGASCSFFPIQMVLIPVDEWSAQISGPSDTEWMATYFNDGSTFQRDYLEIDATKTVSGDVAVTVFADQIAAFGVYNSTTLPIFKNFTNHRIWFIAWGENQVVKPEALFKIKTYYVPRYLTPRGSQ